MTNTNKPKTPPPPGVVALFIAPNGHVIASATDFELSAPGGCSLAEGQSWRARDRVKWQAVKAFSSPAMTDALDGYLLEQIADRMLQKGYRIHIVEIGHSKDAT